MKGNAGSPVAATASQPCRTGARKKKLELCKEELGRRWIAVLQEQKTKKKEDVVALNRDAQDPIVFGGALRLHPPLIGCLVSGSQSYWTLLLPLLLVGMMMMMLEV